jgi:hypothetical protein
MKLINSLTNDEDLRQDLWVAHLSGLGHSELSLKVKQYNLINIEESCHKQDIAFLLRNPLPDDFLSNFTDFERRILYLLAIGYNKGEVGVLLGIGQVRVEQSMWIISKNAAWDNLWHSNDILQMKKDSA